MKIGLVLFLIVLAKFTSASPLPHLGLTTSLFQKRVKIVVSRITQGKSCTGRPLIPKQVL